MTGENDDPEEEILEATYRALCRKGYAEFTLDDIAGGHDRSKGAIFHHFDLKADLFSESLKFLYERYADRLDEVTGRAPRERLGSLLEVVLSDGKASAGQEFRTAMLEVYAQAPYDDTIQSELENFDDLLYEHIRTIIVDGIEPGESHERIAPDLAAEFLVTTISGAQMRRVSIGRSTDQLLETIARYAELLLIEGRPEELRQ